MSISIPGAVFSSLLFHLKNAPSDAEGFLCGSVRCHHVESITDSQCSGTREEKRLYVESFVCFSERFKFYDHYGRPHSDMIHALLGDDAKRVVGWFLYRRNTSHRPSMREKVVHRRLTDCFSGITNRDFLFGLVTEHIVDGSTVHSTDYSFYNWIGTSLKAVKVDIVNLQVTATVPYQLLPITPTPPSLPHYSSTLQQHRSKFTNTEGLMVQALMSEQLYTAILKRLKPLCEELSDASAAVDRETQEIEELEKQLQELHTARTAVEEEQTRNNGSHDDGLNTPAAAAAAMTTIPMTSLLSTNHDSHREQIQVAPLINFESEPPITSSLQHNREIIDLTEITEISSEQLLANGDVPLIDLPNDIQPSVCSSDSQKGANGEVEKGEVGRDDTESVSGSQELF